MAITLGQAKPYLNSTQIASEQAKLGQSQAVGQLQQNIQQLAQGPGGGQVPKTEQIQKLAGEMQTMQAQPSLQAQAQAAEAASQQQKLQQNQQRLQRVRKIQETRQKLQVSSRENEQRLFNLDANLKQQLFDENMKFQKDEIGRTIFNERQLADWAISKAKNEEELMKYEQTTSQILAKKEMLMEQAWKVLEQNLTYAFNKAEQEKDYALRKELYELKAKMQRKMEEMKAKQAGTAALFRVGGTALGAVAGALTFGQPGAIVGATVGSGLGDVAYSMFD